MGAHGPPYGHTDFMVCRDYDYELYELYVFHRLYDLHFVIVVLNLHGFGDHDFLATSTATLGLGYYICVDIIGNTATATTTTSAGNGITSPTPFEPGMVSDCNKFYFVVSDDTCSGIATSQGITVADIELWNPQVGTACTDIWLSDYICVGVRKASVENAKV
ncbi:uncharacterized protein N7503_002973 [Penicillium pulvis]|uniref:uncharacterized protein n=1 Tax=Penicillium pulvis TaxID=1562058 RepID=UPI002549AB10|nr:uncharacterized protein N7503_002973 [Penicillium pulvis]KAJ5810755.1 hypothetical protein N7503_002973 [Penicillium pulvis]